MVSQYVSVNSSIYFANSTAHHVGDSGDLSHLNLKEGKTTDNWHHVTLICISTEQVI